MSVNVAKTFANIPKLAEDGSNYTIFSMCITLAIRAAKGSFVLTCVPDPAQQDEVKKDEQLLKAIVSLLPDKVFRKFLKKDKTFVMLEALKAHYDIKFTAYIAITEAHLFMIKCKSDKHFDKMLNKIKQMKERLDNLGHAINNASYISAIIKATPKAFQSIVDLSTNAINTYNLINPAAPRRLTPTMLLTALHEGHSKHNLLNLKVEDQVEVEDVDMDVDMAEEEVEVEVEVVTKAVHTHDQANEATTDVRGKEEDKKKKDDKSKDTKPQQQQQQQAQSAFFKEITDETAWSAQTDQHICIDAFDSGASLHLTPEKD
ncbi:hypothetical protein EW145_g5740 [Phellinidium pouzarii]|uniref:Uncharacterized protein n=1 Tax=Phellinidium pouzarii TaxID=167371 RepID=A0A4S4KZ76_9AGAM|nr:hypothetical protein EW145_g5740 [Phellinidium pouzarii]